MLRAQQSVLMAAVMLLPTVAWSPSVCCCKTPEPIDTRRQAREAPVKTIIRPHWRQLANTIDRYVRRRRCSVMHRIAAYCYCCSVVCVTDGLCVPCENGGTERDAVVCDVDSSCGPDEPRVTHQPVSPVGTGNLWERPDLQAVHMLNVIREETANSSKPSGYTSLYCTATCCSWRYRDFSIFKMAAVRRKRMLSYCWNVTVPMLYGVCTYTVP